MSDFIYTPLLPVSGDETPYRLLTTEHVTTSTHQGREFLHVAHEGLTLLAEQAMADVSHLLRPGHLGQLRAIKRADECADIGPVGIERCPPSVLAAVYDG